MLTENEWNLDFHFLFLFFYSFSWHTLMEMLFGAFLRCSVALINTIFSLAASLLCMLDNRDVTLHPCLGLKLDVSPHRPPPTPTRDVWVTEAKCTRLKGSSFMLFIEFSSEPTLSWFGSCIVMEAKKQNPKGFWEGIDEKLYNLSTFENNTRGPQTFLLFKVCESMDIPLVVIGWKSVICSFLPILSNEKIWPVLF